ncbi:hypothetical protein AVEN_125941-1, partial [Araneus ventricosus]
PHNRREANILHMSRMLCPNTFEWCLNAAIISFPKSTVPWGGRRLAKQPILFSLKNILLEMKSQSKDFKAFAAPTKFVPLSVYK